jgi:hypothetical protein
MSLRDFCSLSIRPWAGAWLALIAAGLIAPAAKGQIYGAPSTFSNSGIGGYTGQTLQNLYRTDVGNGYTVQSLNQLVLQNAQARVPYVGQQGPPDLGPATIGPGLATRASKPFSTISQTPTVSPYLNLFNTSQNGTSAFNYQTLVRPQLQQQAINQAQMRQNLDVDRKVQALAARGAYTNPAGSDQEYPTGHQTAYMYYGHYYPDAGDHRKRQ